MILYTSLPSPYGRKVRMAALRAGLHDRIERRDVVIGNPDDPILIHNPLGKMPCLVLETGEALFDSPVIVEYFDHLSGGKLLPRDPMARLFALRLQAQADGLTDAAIAMSIEGRFRPPEHVSETWIALQRAKVERTLGAFEKSAPDPGEIVACFALASALGYLDWREPVAWRTGHPRLVAWLDAFQAQNSEYAATAA